MPLVPKQLHTLKTPGAESWVQSCLFSPDKKSLFIACIGDSGSLMVWDTKSGRLKKTLLRHSVSRLALSANGSILVSDDSVFTAHGDGQELLRVWDTRTWRLRHTLDMADIHGFALSPDGRWLALGTYDGLQGAVELRDMARWRVVHIWPSKFEVSPSWITFSPDSRVVAATALYGDAGIGEMQV